MMWVIHHTTFAPRSMRTHLRFFTVVLLLAFTRFAVAPPSATSGFAEEQLQEHGPTKRVEKEVAKADPASAYSRQQRSRLEHDGSQYGPRFIKVELVEGADMDVPVQPPKA